MHWEKLGQIYYFEPSSEYILSHASNPLAVHLEDDVFRVYFSGRNECNKSSVAYVDFDIVKREKISQSEKEVFRYGADNSFYSHGVSIGNVYEVGTTSYMLFMGWQIENEEHWRGDIGVLTLSATGQLSATSCVPFIGSDAEDKVSLSYPWVIHEDGIYKMWYGSTIDWTSDNGEMIHVIKYATSDDGLNWDKHGLAIPYEIGVAQAFSRPSVIKINNDYHMWYSYRSGDGSKYKIGYSNSADGIEWVRHKDSGISVSQIGWDSEMICYPFVFKHKDNIYMLYNGNGYGKYGFGLAVLTDYE